MEIYVPRLLPFMPRYLSFLILTAFCASLLPCSLCLDTQYEYCQNTTKCGNMDITYPFGVGNRGCGLPNYQINCTQNSSPVIWIHGQSYTIVAFRRNISLIARGENCQFLDDRINRQIVSSEFANTAFRISGTEKRTVFVYKCKEDQLQLSKCNATVQYTLNDNVSSIPGCSMAQATLLDVSIMEAGVHKDEKCKSCEASGGICGYKNTSDSTAATPFVCYCKDGPRTHECPGHGPENKSAIVIGWSIGGAALTAIAVALLTFYLKRGKHSLPHRGSSTSKVERFLKEYAYEMPTRYSQSGLKKITNNYAEKLGEGGYGVVYKGKLPNDVLVAVKLLDRHRHSETQFMNEVATIGRVHHVNLVRLLGYCFETPTSALVYEYMVNGSLEKFIFAGKEKGQILGWEQLHSIALGTARGIAYLHQDCEKRIIHFDIKPHNILLDADFTPKVADFGLAKLCVKGVDHLSMTVARGTPRYVAPEVCDSNVGHVTDKPDVYSFGMLLLEIVGGRKNFDWGVSRSSQYYFPEWVFKVLDSGELALRLRGEEETEAEDEEKARRLTKVGLWCIQYNYRDRPCMNRVVQMLEGIGDDVSNPPLPINSSTTIENTCENPLLSST